MRNDTWKAKGAALALVIGLVLPGCAGAKKQPTPTTPGAGTTTTTNISAGMVTDVGGLNDKSFNEAAWNGLQRLQKEKGARVKAIESKRQEEYEPNIATMVDGGYNIIWGIGFLMGDAVSASAAKYPNQKFGLIDAEGKGNNVESILFKEHEGSFLMGIIAAKTTKSKKVGFVGGMDIPVIKRFEAGFKAGVQSIDPSVQVLTVYSGSFTDPGKGKDVALNMINQGADIVYHAAGSTGEGVIEAAKEKGVFAIGVDKDQNPLAPETVISSMIKRVDLATYEYSLKAAEGGFTGGKAVVLGLKEDGVGYAPSTKWEKMPAGTKELVDKWLGAIKAGTVTVPGDLEALKTFKPPTL
jgi:basic membrane protein A